MTGLALVTAPAAVLHTPTEPVGEQLGAPEVQEVIAALLARCQELARADRGCVGLAAPQLGSLWRIAVVYLPIKHPRPEVVIDPEITRRSGRYQVNEECLSLPQAPREVRVERAKMVGAHWTAPNGKARSFRHLHGLWGQVLQHEVDHLDGLLITDRQVEAPEQTARLRSQRGRLRHR